MATGLDHVTAELQEAIMRTRMQTIGTVFGKFRRVVRDLSVKLGKDCQLHVEGEDVEVDKSIIESIGDPLTHLIRNAVDHGIESDGTTAGQRETGARDDLPAGVSSGRQGPHLDLRRRTRYRRQDE